MIPFAVEEKIVVYDRSTMQYNMPGLLAANGDILTGFTDGVDVAPGSSTFMLRSGDMGRTYELTGLPFGPTKPEHAGAGSASLCFHDGVLFGLRLDAHIPRHSEDTHWYFMKNQRDKVNRNFVMLSEDHGHTWDVRNEIPTAAYRRFNICSVFLTADEEIVLFGYGVLHEDFEGFEKGGGPLVDQLITIRSRDRGAVWTSPEILHSGEPALNEISVDVLPDGTFVALARQGGEKPLCMLKSGDGGRNWSEPVETPMLGQCLDLKVTPKGRLFTAFRKTAGPGGNGCGCYWSEDGGTTWEGPLMLEDPKGRTSSEPNDNGGQSIVVLPDDSLYVIFYSNDTESPFTHPLNDKTWGRVKHFWKRYIAANILREES